MNCGAIALRAVRVCRRLGLEYCGLQFGRRQFLPSLGRRSRHLHRSAAAEIKLFSKCRRADRHCARAEMLDVIYPGYGFLSENDPFTESPQTSRPDLHRPPQRRHRSDRRQSRGASSRGCRRPNSHRPRLRRPINAAAAARRVAPRLVFRCWSRQAEGRRSRHAGAQRGEDFVAQFEQAAAEAVAAFGDADIYLERFFPHAATSRSRCSPTCTAMRFTFGNAIASRSGATRSWSRKRPSRTRIDVTRRQNGGSRRRLIRAPNMSTPARSNSSSTARAANSFSSR